MIERLRHHPLAIFLPLQALIGFWNLGLLSPWMDEAGTLTAERLPLAGVIGFAAHDVHPPLFYIVLCGWQRLPLGLDWAVQARALSVVFALLATVALDRLWASSLPRPQRFWLLALWSLSPCLLLYSRMCRSYSLQVLLVTVAAAYVVRVARAPDWRRGGALALAPLAVLYTHYAAGLAVLAAANLALAIRRRGRALAAIDAAVGVGYLPWIWHLAASLGSWSGHAQGYALTGTALLEIPLKLAYWAVSFTMGEAVPDAALVFGALVFPLLVWMVCAGARRHRETAWLAAAVACIGFIGVARWVSYPFIPARLLFVLPFFLLLMVAGAGAYRRAGNVAMAAMLLLSLSGAWCYFHRSGFRNKQYPVPVAEIARQIARTSTARDSVILVDSANSDPVAMEYALGGTRPVLRTTDPAAAPQLAARLADPEVRIVWFLRNTHDVSAGGLNAQFDARLRAAMPGAAQGFEPYTGLERALLRAAGNPDPPRYSQELIEYRR